MTTEIATTATSAGDLMWNQEGFAHAQRLAKMFASSTLVPDHLRGKVADVTIALLMARRLGEDPLIIMQSMFVVHGKAGWSAQYVIGRANRSGVFRGRISWRVQGEGDSLEVTAYAVLADTGEEVSFEVSMAMAHAEGWSTRKGNKYGSLPHLMLRYRSAVYLVRLYCPEVMLGIPTSDEIEDVGVAVVDAEVVDRPAPSLRGALGIEDHVDIEEVEATPDPVAVPADTDT